jgi:hypothetical protein
MRERDEYSKAPVFREKIDIYIIYISTDLLRQNRKMKKRVRDHLDF